VAGIGQLRSGTAHRSLMSVVATGGRAMAPLSRAVPGKMSLPGVAKPGRTVAMGGEIAHARRGCDCSDFGCQLGYRASVCRDQTKVYRWYQSTGVGRWQLSFSIHVAGCL
jgi:hypothetical protein